MDEERRKALGRLEEALSYRFENAGVLDEALTHRSYARENPDPPKSDNGRLEFLGDAVLSLCVGDLLMRKYPGEGEGQLTKMRASLVNEKYLSDLAETLGLGDFLLLGRGEDASGGRSKPSILAGAFEALAASLYLDGGLELTREFLEAMFEPFVGGDAANGHFGNFKSELQEMSQAQFRLTPVYTILRESGPDHERVFEVQVAVGGVIRAVAEGHSKKEAEQQAARRALEALKG